MRTCVPSSRSTNCSFSTISESGSCPRPNAVTCWRSSTIGMAHVHAGHLPAAHRRVACLDRRPDPRGRDSRSTGAQRPQDHAQGTLTPKGERRGQALNTLPVATLRSRCETRNHVPRNVNFRHGAPRRAPARSAQSVRLTVDLLRPLAQAAYLAGPVRTGPATQTQPLFGSPVPPLRPLPLPLPPATARISRSFNSLTSSRAMGACLRAFGISFERSNLSIDLSFLLIDSPVSTITPGGLGASPAISDVARGDLWRTAALNNAATCCGQDNGRRRSVAFTSAIDTCSNATAATILRDAARCHGPAYVIRARVGRPERAGSADVLRAP
jgi:hypothetical protein